MILLIWLLLVSPILCDAISEEELMASTFVDNHCEELKYKMYESTNASWNHATNVTDENGKTKSIYQEKLAKLTKNAGLKAKKFNYENFSNETLKRLLKDISTIGDALLNKKDYRDLYGAITRMQSNYAKVKVPSFRNSNQLVSLEPEITEILETSRDPSELQYYWTKWYDLAGTPCRNDFFKYAALRNKAAKLNNFANGAESWLDSYEDPTFEKQIEDILAQIQPLYQQLHAYIRFKLYKFYGPKHVALNKPIPMHLLGNMWGQKWDILDIVLPYKDVTKVDVTAELLRQNYTARKMFETAEEFFTSIGLQPMPPSFWEKSVIEKPNDGREIICHASAWNFGINNDVRIKQCTRVSFESFTTVHHEMGHVEYYLEYDKQPVVFRQGANPGFHEAIGDTIALSVASTKHLRRLGLLPDDTNDPKAEINQIFRMGLQKLAFLPFGYIMDKFRYDVFRGNIQPENANCHFWRLREKFGGIGPASVRGNRDFDITAKYHASADVEYMRYFVSNIIQFQFHKAACIKADEYIMNDPEKTINNCDIYQNANVGNAFKSMLEMGSSRPWTEALEVMTGERKLDAGAFLEYFRPLEEWLVKTNRELGVTIGWEPSDFIDCP